MRRSSGVATLDNPNGGQFHGGVTLRRELESGVIVVTTPSEEARALKAKHYHEHPYFWMSLGGDCSEEIEGVGEREYSPYTLTYHPKGEVHAHRRGPVPPTGFGIVLLDKMAERAALFAPMAEVPQELRGEPFMRIAHQMVNEVRNADSSSTLALEALTLELIVCSSRARFTHEARRPRWLTQACELIESDYETDIKIAEIAATVGVHPAHLAAQFKQHLRCTPGQFIRGLRVQKSQPLLEQTALSVAVIAVTCGFYDEAHFCRTFKAVVGCTPTEFRRR